MGPITKYLQSSIGKKQIVAVSGLLLIAYVIGHLAGNFLIFAGPEGLNGWAEKLKGFGVFLRVIEFALFSIFVIHMYVTALIVIENRRARGKGYSKFNAVGKRSIVTQLMPYTGTFILAFVIWHVLDFTLIDHSGPRGIMPDGTNLGLYGVVYTSFMNPIHSLAYIFALMCLGLHLSHGLQSFMQTFGFNDPRYAKSIKSFSNCFGVLIAVGYSTIPIYILIDSLKYK